MDDVIVDSQFWDKKYINKEDRWDLGHLTPFFKDYESQISKNDTVLVPGCGRGYDAIYYSKRNHDVYALDYSNYSINYLKSRKIKENLNLKILKCDFFNLSKKYNNMFDIIIEYTFFCAIHPNNRICYVKKCHDLLKDNGKIAGIFLPLNKTENHNSPPYIVDIKSLLKIFEKYFKINYIKHDFNSVPTRIGNELFIEFEKK